MAGNAAEFLSSGGEDLVALSEGALLTVQAGAERNTMTVSWGMEGTMWARSVFMVMVRRSRHTFSLIERADSFTVSFPDHPDAKKWLAYCGSKSGRDGDKFAALGLKTLPAKRVNGIIIDCPGTHFEARILHRVDMAQGTLDKGVQEAHYVKDGLHVLYFGEILARYTK